MRFVLDAPDLPDPVGLSAGLLFTPSPSITTTKPPMEVSNINVLVRVRPLLEREDSDSIVRMPQNEPGVTYLETPSVQNSSLAKETSAPSKKYTFDQSIWSFNAGDANYNDNLAFYRKSGLLLLDHFFQGYNVCLLAYGQTGSGKTYTMMGSEHEPGVIPLMVRDIMRHKDHLVDQKINCDLSFSYVEIYNEKVKDLLDNSRQCRVREHPLTGPYVENLTVLSLSTYEEFCQILSEGNNNRMTAATKMNVASSRSHAVITFTLKQTRFAEDSESELDVGEAVEEMVSNIKLVDLAGSERLAKTQVFGQTDRMKEGSQINKSLTVLGRCINILALGAKLVVPYRDSTLTYLLRENLAGNSKTAMVFCISPCDYEETHQTLNYASQVKKIKTAAKANSSTMLSAPIDWDKLKEMDKSVIDTLREQVDALTAELDTLKSSSSTSVGALMKYLERESTKQAFEIKYLKHVIQKQNTQVAELNTQNVFLHKELLLSTRNSVHSERLRMRNEILQLKTSCNQHKLDILRLLVDFDPARAF